MSDEVVITQADLGVLHAREIELIHLIRTRYRWGELKIEVSDGLPVFLVQTVKREKLG